MLKNTYLKIISVVICVLFAVDSFYAPVSFGQDWKVKAREEDRLQKKYFKISQLLDKARALRFEKKFKDARKHAEKALRMDPNNPEAKAFLDYLKIEEQEYQQEQARLKREKLRAKEDKKAAKLREKQEKLRAKKAEQQASRKVKAPQVEKEAADGAGEKALPAPEAAVQAQRPPLKAVPLPPVRKVKQTKKSIEKQEAQPLTAGKEQPMPEAGDADVDVSGALTGDMSKMKPGQSIVVDGDKVEFNEKDSTITAEGNVSITYGDVKLSSDKIKVNTKTQVALCEGNVRIEQGEDIITGDRIRYDFKDKEGEILGGELEAYPWFGNADEVSRVAENEYVLKGGFITTCDEDKPHYSLKAEEIRVFPGDKVIAKNVTAYIGTVPVMWFPYYYHPIIRTKAKVQVIPGKDGDWGYFLLSTWRMHLKGQSKADFHLDYRTKKGFGYGADLYYTPSDFGLEGLGYGMFRAYFVNQNDFGTYEKSVFREGDDESPELRSRIQWKHRVDFDPATVGMFEFNKLSDEYFLKDYFYNEYEENETLPNYFSIISSRENYNFSVGANWRANNFFTVTQRLPEVKMSIPDQRLWDLPLYYGSEMSAVYFEKKYDNYSNPPERVGRLDSWHKLSYVTGIGPVNITPYATVRGTAYSNGRWTGNPYGRLAWGAGVSAYSRFHKIYDFQTDFAGLNIKALRHIIVPRVDYFHMPQPTVDKDNLFQMDDIDGLAKENKFTFSLETKLQAKRGDDKALDTTDLVRFITSVDYEFRLKKNNLEMQKEGDFRDLKFLLELRPYDWLYLDSDLEITPKNQALKTGSVEASINPNKNFYMAFGYRYEKLPDEPRNQFTYDMGYKINPKWKVGAYGRFNLQTKQIEEQQYTITRDLHCWEVEAAYDVKGTKFFDPGEFTFWLAFKIKAFPDMPIGLSRSFTKRAPGALIEPTH